MKRFLNKITPSFIHQINHGLLKNSALGWQLQLPTIIWLWFLITVVTLPIPFLFDVEKGESSDIAASLAMAIFIGVLEFFLFGYIIIQFNSTKSFGRKIFAHGIKEQFGYLIIMFLCLTNVILFPGIMEWRKSHLMSEEEIKKEAIIYNKARHYFMDKYDEYLYFPNRTTLTTYMNMGYSESGEYHSRDEYYNLAIRPKLEPYFPNYPDLETIDKKYNRTSSGPKLYYVGSDYLKEEYIKDDDYYYDYASVAVYDPERAVKHNLGYQFISQSDKKRLEDIKNFIALYNKYEDQDRYENYETVSFESPNVILQKYKANEYTRCIINSDNYHISMHKIANVHGKIFRAKDKLYKNFLLRLFICLNVALVFAVLAFAYKNVKLKEFILTFVYSALTLLVLIIFTIITRTKEDLPIHTPIILFFFGLVCAITSGSWRNFSHIGTTLVIFSNICFAFAPFYFFLYFYEYLEWFKYPYEYCQYNSKECDELRAQMKVLQWVFYWGGIIFYMFVGSIIYKKAYERIFALPLHK